MIVFSIGNTKIGRDTAIFNITPACECMSEKLGLCKIADKCYAKKAERMYKDSKPFRYRQTAFWDENTIDSFVEYFKAEVLTRNMKYLRFQESGDFRTQLDVDKMSGIAEKLEGIVRCYTYTARRDLDFSNVSDNLVINGSGFMVDNCFYVIHNETEMIGNYLCKGNCRECNLCKHKLGIYIAVKIH